MSEKVCNALLKKNWFHILSSLKKFRPRNLKYDISTKQTNKDAPLLKISIHASLYLSLTSNQSHQALNFLGDRAISNSNSTIHLEGLQNFQEITLLSRPDHQ